MRIIALSENNLEWFEDLIDPETAENIGRLFYRAIAVMKDVTADECLAIAVWELMLPNEAHGMDARLEKLIVMDPEAGELAIKEFVRSAGEEGAVRCYLELPKPSNPREKGGTAPTGKECGNTTVIKELFQKTGFRIDERESSNIVVTVKELSEIALPKSRMIHSDGSPENHFLKEFGLLKVRPFHMGIVTAVLKSRRTLMGDLENLPYNWFDQELSCCLEKGEEVTGFLLVHRTPLKRLEMDLLEAHGANIQINILSMIRFSLKQVQRLYPEDTKIIIRRRDETITKAVAQLLPSAKGEPVFYGEYLLNREEKTE